MSRGSQVRLVAGVVVALVIFAVLTVLLAPVPRAPALSTRSAEPDGAMALQLWLRRSGFTVREIVSYDDLDNVDLLFVLEPLFFHYEDDDAIRVSQWVEDGHTLIAAGTPFALNTVLRPYEVALEYLSIGDATLTLAAPTLLHPPVNPFRGEAVATVLTERRDLLVHVYSGTQPVLASFAQGDGRVWVAGALRPFTNRGLQDANNANLIMNLIAGLPADSVIGFDEAAHGFGAVDQQSVAQWLFGTPAGWSILLLIAVIMTYLASRGRRFGRAVPLPSERLRRESVEYVVAMANLYRRAGQRSAVLAHYEQQLRRRVAERYAVDPRLDSAEFVRAIAYRDDTFDTQTLDLLLKRLSRSKVSEQELVQTIFDVDTFLRSLS